MPDRTAQQNMRSKNVRTVMKEFVYDKPPLIEVICEIRWRLQPLVSAPGTAIDPHFSSFSDDFTNMCKTSSFSLVERINPENVPVEFLAGHPIYRFRKQQNQWPLFQIGPGLLTVNDVPPLWRLAIVPKDTSSGS
jgi:uncharacterized protein (TIGR04255 family)